MEEKLIQLEKQVKLLKLMLVITLSSIALILFSFSKNQQSKFDVIRAKGVIIEDEKGKERILIGTPVPFAKHRARTDTLKIKNTWGARYLKKFPQYMEWYKGYDHTCNGILILDENGWERIAIGDPTPDPIIGKRIAPSTGIILNDDKGLERSGYGMLNVDGQLRVNIGLDHDNGIEGAVLSVSSDGTAGVSLNSKDGKSMVFVGHAEADNWRSLNDKTFTGMYTMDSTKQKIVVGK